MFVFPSQLLLTASPPEPCLTSEDPSEEVKSRVTDPQGGCCPHPQQHGHGQVWTRSALSADKAGQASDKSRTVGLSLCLRHTAPCTSNTPPAQHRGTRGGGRERGGSKRGFQKYCEICPLTDCDQLGCHCIFSVICIFLTIKVFPSLSFLIFLS